MKIIKLDKLPKNVSFDFSDGEEIDFSTGIFGMQLSPVLYPSSKLVRTLEKLELCCHL